MLIEIIVGLEKRIAFIIMVFKYSVVVSISSFVFREINAEVE